MLAAIKHAVSDSATLYIGHFGNGARWAEFVDAADRGVPKSRKWAIAISTQVGCPVGCVMCDVGTLNYGGNLDADEMLEQIRHVVRQNPGINLESHPEIEIHFTRMGEPSLNRAVLGALKRLAWEMPYPGITPLISTVAPKSPAIKPFFEELLELKENCFSGGRFQLQFSLHATDEAARRRIVPIKKWSLQDIADYGARFVGPADRKIVLSFVTVKGGVLDAAFLARTFDPEKFAVKIASVVPTAAAVAHADSFEALSPPDPMASALALRRRGFDVIQAAHSPEEIRTQAACGQVSNRNLRKKPASVFMDENFEPAGGFR